MNTVKESAGARTPRTSVSLRLTKLPSLGVVGLIGSFQKYPTRWVNVPPQRGDSACTYLKLMLSASSAPMRMSRYMIWSHCEP